MLRDEFGPWVEHDGSGRPVPAGTVLQAKCECVTGRVVCIIGTANRGAIWDWSCYGVKTAWRVLAYRIRKPRGLSVLEEAISDAIEPVSA